MARSFGGVTSSNLVRFSSGICVLAIAASVSGLTTLVMGCVPTFAQGAVTYLDQGWTDAEKQWWYTASQGSRLVPLSWLMALEQRDGTDKYLSDANVRKLGYLPDGTTGNALPLGFVVDQGPAPDGSQKPWVGMTCAACHTGEFTYGRHRVRIDGAPTLADFQSLTESLLASLDATRTDLQKLDRFVRAILGATPSPPDRASLIADLDRQIAWFTRLAAKNAAPIRYGHGRLDAQGHILNKIALSVGASEPLIDFPSDAPASYPFLWTTPQHEPVVQWNGIAPQPIVDLTFNGKTFDLGAMLRNTTELIGVFGSLDVNLVPGRDGYASSLRFENMIDLENLVKRLPEVRELFFELVAAGKFTNCADIAHSVAVNAQANYRERMDALGALIALGDGRLASIAASTVTDEALWPANVARSASMRLFPKHLSVKQLCAILPRVKEPKRTIGDLSWKLPQLIADEGLPSEALEGLRVGLTTLVTDGAEWRNEKWPHTQSKRPDLVPSLIAVCIRQFRVGVTTPELFRSSVLALRFTKDESSSERPAKELREFLASASSEQREVAFWADDALLQALHPVKDAWGRVFHVSHYGGIRLNAEKDRAWVMRRLADKGNLADEREMMLYAAMIELLRPGDEVLKVLESLKPYVADAPPLVAIIESRMKPASGSEELRRLEEERARRKLESEDKDEKARASWIEFWCEIASKPDIVFNEHRADNTAWNLWQTMERSGHESRASGWNRRFIEQQFGHEVADLLRTALLRMWRKDKPTLRSERPADTKNTFLVKWQLGLAAIYAEAEDPLWATKLTDEEARLASRYEPIELNGFPTWLDSLVVAHPKAVDAVLGEELSLSLRETFEDSNAAISLQNVRHATPQVAALFTPRIKTWLDETLGGRPGNDPAIVNRLSQAVGVLMQSEDQNTRKALADIAAHELSKGLQSPFAKVWMPVLMQLNPEAGVSALETGLKVIQPSQRGEGVDWFSVLFGRDRRETTVDLQRADFTPKLLLRLVRLAYQHVRPADDAHREGSYSPDDRDHAEQGRNAVLNALLATTGTEGWAAKLEMAQDPLFANFKDRAMAIARERAAEEVDGAPLSDVQFVALDRYGEAAPSTRDGMFTVMRDRLEDIDDLLLDDVSPREAWANITDERVMRREIARELRNHSNHVYTVDQEATTADEKETDIRMRATASPQQATIELKIGDKSRTAADLRAAIKDQLLKKYMAAEDCRSGCLIVTIATDKTWAHSDIGKQLNFDGLIAMLNEEANQISAELGGSVRLMAKGLDLRPRLKTERAAAKAKKTK